MDRTYEAPNRIEQRSNIFVMSFDCFLQLSQFSCKFLVAAHHLEELYKGANDQNIHLDDAFAFQDGKERGDAMLGKVLRKGWPSAPSFL